MVRNKSDSNSPRSKNCICQYSSSIHSSISSTLCELKNKLRNWSLAKADGKRNLRIKARNWETKEKVKITYPSSLKNKSYSNIILFVN